MLKIVLSTYVIEDVKGEEVVGTFTRRNFQRSIKKNLRGIKGNEFYVKWKGYDNSFNSWMSEKDIV